MNSSQVYYPINKKLKEGNHDAFVQIYTDNNKLLYNFIKKYIQEEHIVDDIIHDSFIQLWNARERILTNYKIENYIFKIVRNTIYKYFKEKTRTVALENDSYKSIDILSENFTEQRYQDLEYEKIYNLAVEQLPPQRKRIFKMSREDGLSYSEIAEHLNISPNTVKEHMSIAMKTIKAYLMKEYDLVLTTLILMLF